MTATAWILAVVGFGLQIAGAIVGYRGRMRQVPGDPGYYTTPGKRDGAIVAALVIIGAVVALAGGVIGILI